MKCMDCKFIVSECHTDYDGDEIAFYCSVNSDNYLDDPTDECNIPEVPLMVEKIERLESELEIRRLHANDGAGTLTLLATALQKMSKLRKELANLEWCIMDDEWLWHCPSCGNCETLGHTATCGLAEALKDSLYGAFEFKEENTND